MGRKPNTQKQLERWAADPFAYIFEAVNTKDEHDLRNPVKPFPKKDYLVEMLRIMHHGENVENVIKSRQLMMSWIAVAYISWLARFHEHRNIFVQSKKKEDAAIFVFDAEPYQARLSFIETNLPEHARQQIMWRYGKAIYPNGSRVEAIPQGPKHYESRVASYVVNDECSLQDLWASGMAAAKPMITGGGRMLNIATVRPSQYADEMSTFKDDAIPKEEVIPGMWRFRSASDASATAIHYSADPEKNLETEEGRAWYADAIKGYPGGPDGHKWRQHMEIDFGATSSTLLIENWKEIKKLAVIDPIPPRYQIGWKYWAGFDYGKRNATVWGCFASDRDGNQHIIGGVWGPGLDLGGVPGIADRMMEHDYWEKCGPGYADPSIWNNNQAEDSGGYTSIAKLFRKYGVYFKPAPVKGQEADDIAIERLLHHYWADPDSPKLFIWRTAEIFLREWPGLRFQDYTELTQGDHALKEQLVDRANNSFDAWKYAESKRPKPTIYTGAAPANTLDSIRKRAIKELKRREAGTGRRNRAWR